MLRKSPSELPVRADIVFPEFVALIAMMMALTALSVDIMLPALGEIGRSLQIKAANDRQLIITFYLIGFSVGQFFFGPFSDRYGRRRPLFIGLLIFAVATLMAQYAQHADTMFTARILQGFGAAAPRVIAIAIVRDRFAGRQMARVMSFVMMVFIVVPVLAPLVGQAVLNVGAWRSVFLVLLAVSLITLAWTAWRLPETKSDRERFSLSFRDLGRALHQILTTPQTVGYAVAFGFFFGVLMSYIGSAQQIFVEIYGLKDEFPLVFGLVALVMLPASVLNSRLVSRQGMRRVSTWALVGFLMICALMALKGFPEKPSLTLFCVFVGSTFFCFGLIGPNYNALAMEHVGNIAGTASSFIGFYTTGAGAFLGWVVGHFLNGTVRPLTIGYTLLGLAALATVLITERVCCKEKQA
jgi:MFS transporter, DHA1 family, multidrug resistance protein